jgi:[glutamine synthetase] adenylyltransferase / [glutamine synthetase]-adenylyl-L-tyrosine phosphorylase
MPRGTLAGQLAAMGFVDTARAQVLIGELALDVGAAGDDGRGLPDGGPAGDGADAQLLQALAAAADPDQALAALARMAPDAELLQALRDNALLRERLVSVLGASAALGDHLSRHPADWRLLADDAAFPAKDDGGELRDDLLAAVGADGGPEPVATRQRGSGSHTGGGCCSWRPST